MPDRRHRWIGPALMLLALVLVAPLLSTAAAPPLPDFGRLGIAVKIHPVAGRERTFRCEMTLTDLAAGTVLSQPEVLFLQGQDAKIRAGIRSAAGGAEEAVLSARVDEAATAASYEVVLTRGGETIATQQATVQLR